MVGVISLDLGNIGSWESLLEELGLEYRIVDNGSLDLSIFDSLILPGVGSYDVDLLRFKDFQGVIDDWFPLQTPGDITKRDGTNAGGSLKLRLQFTSCAPSQSLLLVR